MKKIYLAALVACTALSGAQATSFVFTSSAFNLTIDVVDPITPNYSSDGTYTVLSGTGTLNGQAYNFSDIFFGSSSYYGGFSYDDSYTNLFTGPQIYTDPAGGPTFADGVYTLTSYNDSSVTGTLTVNGATAAVPEPASWAMMVGGFGLLGGALRRKKATVSFA